MRILAAFDKFKDALSASDVCRVARETLESSLPNIRVSEVPLTDGGEGFCDILTRAVDGRFSSYVVAGPLGKPVEARIGYVDLGLLSTEVRVLASLPSVVAVSQCSSASVMSASTRTTDACGRPTWSPLRPRCCSCSCDDRYGHSLVPQFLGQLQS